MNAVPDTRPSPLADRLRLTLALAWIALIVAGAALGERPTSFGALTTALAADQVHSVSISGQGLPAQSTGRATQWVHWRRNGVHRVATVVVRSPGEETNRTVHNATTITATDVGEYLKADHPNLRVTRTATIRDSTNRFGWRVPTWLAVSVFAIELLTLLLLVNNPQPWRATRWAWFWVWTTPIGTPAFLLMSGPTPLIPAPRDLTRRLTGGWAFFLAVIVFGGNAN
jgi:hypothetical protein